MPKDIRKIYSLNDLINYFADNLRWPIDFDEIDDVNDITYDFEASDIGLKEEAFAKISSLKQLQDISEQQKWGIFCVEFDSNKFEINALRKILSGLVPKRRNSEEHKVWDKNDLMFICFWGKDNNRTIGVSHFEDNEKGLPQIKIIYCSPANEDFTQINNFEDDLSKLSWVSNTSDTERWHNQWASAFTKTYHQQIDDSQTLAKALAELARHTRDTIIKTYNIENSFGYVHLLYKEFKDKLMHDLNIEQFADMYAQTVSYGLFSAKCMDDGESFDWNHAIESIPNTNPFLKSLIKSCFERNANMKSLFDELELAEIIKLLDNTNIKAILDNFNRRTGGGREDTVIYFYEDFLSAYEHETKKRRGVYYTPWPVVKFMVRAVDDILKKEFGYADGLADTSTKKIEYLRDSKKKNSRGFISKVTDMMEVPAIQILDPATGTGTFLREVILNIHDTFVEKNKGKSENEIKKLWNEYVPKHLLKRINGFELMMAPYAVAHMKLAMVLKETGYDFNSNQRLNVMLTNSLDPSLSDADSNEYGQQLSMFNDPLAIEAFEADKTKNNQGINIIIGNPPYSGESANKGEWIMNLMDDYKKEPNQNVSLKEDNSKFINDDYVKFIRYAQYCISNSGKGIVAFINPHGFLDSPTFRGMRWELLKSFDIIYTIDLHGNAKRKEKCPDGSKDENVFDIQQGVCIMILVKKNGVREQAIVRFFDVWGLRDYKYEFLNKHSIYDVNFLAPQLQAPKYNFNKLQNSLEDQYNKGFSVKEFMPLSSLGVLTKRDILSTNYSITSLKDSIYYFMNKNITTEEACDKFGLSIKDKDKWDAAYTRSHYCLDEIDDDIVRVYYRPFDVRYLLYNDLFVARKNTKVLSNVNEESPALILCRQGGAANTEIWDCISVTNTKSDQNYFRRGGGTVFPLYLLDDSEKRKVNFNEVLVSKIEKMIGLLLSDSVDITKYFRPIDIFDYIYAVLHSPKYREKYKEFLKIDFPRVPYPTNQEMFWKMVSLGKQIREIHLMESSLLDTLITTYPVIGENTVDKITYKDNKVYINKTQYFDGVSELAWNFYIGGYQPLQKWLKDRKGMQLSDEDIVHYQKIVVALTETDRLMKKIDEVFEF